MSYSRHYSGEVAYSGSKTIHYPASEHGGTATVHYSGTVPVGIDIHVDTDPFDRSISDASASLNAVAGALSAAEAAQIASIQRAGKKISDTAIRGFFRVISSELSAQTSESSSAMNSTVGLILELSNRVAAVHEQMDGDYHAIKARYLRVFDELDRELDRRIRELDRPAFQLSDRGMREVVEGPVTESAAFALVQTQDSNVTPLRLSCAREKSVTSDALSELSQVCGYITSYADAVEGTLYPAAGEEIEFLPVIYAKEQDLRSGAERLIVKSAEKARSTAAENRVAAVVAQAPQERWQTVDEDQARAIYQSFVSKVDGYLNEARTPEERTRRERACQRMLSLYQGNSATTLCMRR